MAGEQNGTDRPVKTEADRRSNVPTVTLPPPTIGSYRLVEQLGSGGMSSVFRAVHIDTGHEVAVKVLPRYLAKNPTLLQRFLREAKTAELLEDPNIVAIYDRGTEEGRHYLVLEFVPGGDLHDRVRDGGPLPLREAVRVIREVAGALKRSAARGLIHRDIKPANMLMAADGTIKIIDLGLALLIEQEDERVTRDGTTVGTVDYMAPEQGRDSRAASIRSDIYSLGCTFYYLLTGFPPFPGGDVTDKLKRHAYDPAPDIRKLRPDVPEMIARVIQKMMAKKPEQRFKNYDQLSEVLEIFESIPADAQANLPILDALIDDDDDEAPVLDAIIDDEDDEEGFMLGEGSIDTKPISTADAPPVADAAPWRELAPLGDSAHDAAPIAEINFAELNRLEESDESEPLPPPRTPRAAPIAPVRAPIETLPLADEPAESARHAPAAHAITRDEASSVRNVIFGGLLAGAAIVLLAVGVRNYWITPDEGASTESGENDAEALAPADPTPGRTAAAPAPSPTARPQPKAPPSPDRSPSASAVAKSDRPALPATPAATTKWVEPAERDLRLSPEPPLPPDLIARVFEPRGWEEIGPAQNESPIVSVRRADAAREPISPLRKALDLPTGTIEIADDGPFFEENLQYAGKSRVIRGRAGHRPIIVLEPPTQPSNKTRSALITIEPAGRLSLENVDLVIRARDLPRQSNAVFMCDGGSLTLRDCSITIDGPPGHDFAIVQVGEPGSIAERPEANIRFERAVVRGVATAFRLCAAARVAVSRSVIVTSQKPIFSVQGEPALARELALSRSLLASSSSLLELTGSASIAGAKPVVVRSVACTFAAIGSERPASALIAKRNQPAGHGDGPAADWRGDRNTYHGWPAWYSPKDGAGKIDDLFAAKQTWKGTDSESRESTTAMPAEAADPWLPPDALSRLAPEQSATVARACAYSPALREKSVAAFEFPGGGASAVAVPPALANTPARSAGELVFDVTDPAHGGDLGRFLKERAANPGKLSVRVIGGGRRTFTPVRLSGVDLTLIGPEGFPEGVPLVFTPAPDAPDESLLDVRDGTLTLVNMRFDRQSSSNVRTLIRIDHGWLEALRCWFTAPNREQRSASLITIRGDGSRPTNGAGPGARLSDCLLISGVDGLTCDLGRGAVSLSNCAIAAGSSAIVVRPQMVRADVFHADLRLDRCTIAAERAHVRVEPWPNAVRSPDRPFVVTSSRCAFLDEFDRSPGAAAAELLQVDARSFARGIVMWQAEGDAYAVSRFIGVDGESESTAQREADTLRHWQRIWGSAHVRDVLGPGTGPRSAGIRFARGKLQSGSIQPADLALEPTNSNRAAASVGADLIRIGVPVSTKSRARP